MKKYIYSLAIAMSALTLNSCIGDLDTMPLNETDKTAEQVYVTLGDFEKGLAYIYGSFSLVSQSDPGSADINVGDAGASELVRQYMVLNEMSVGSLKCVWGDAYVADLQNNSWTTAPNDALIAVYTRCMMIVTRANEFLLQSDKKIDMEGIKELRAEARFLRSLGYYILLDLFGNPPFALPENIGGVLPTQIGREGLFNWIESELKAIISGEGGEALPNKGSVAYPRADKGAAQAVLARMYLNAEVYTGTARWADAKAAAEAVIAMGYKLCPNYEELFMQDNTENLNARNEFIFAIAYDRDKTQSYGGTTALINASLGEDANNGIAAALGYPAGTKISRDQWNGYHVPNEYVANFDLVGVDWEAKSGFGYNREKSDRRAFFYNIGGVEAYDKANVNSGWRCWKFNSRASDGTLYSTDNYTIFSSADFPMFRLAEMYLIYAEAQARLDGGTTTDSKAMGYIKELRDRAGVTTPSSINLDFILKERACELMWEGHRRTDLIRYGYFTAMSYPWPYKGGIPDGKVALPSYRTVYPLLQSDLSENPNLVQNTGYQSNN
ncbi:RagB/SusD family nutrient uptake outer membrane protein [Bacteroides stercorirosoris]|jgi:hypothetical protein|uniref:Starch-binding associating with outer membrane n=1 Tax=Bacteroides stercorirosoris TaxID=871324 RepID=A0A1M6CDH5_9BACE|nr:RagB/SusD family nutrient uptake outer membrane protein [Bacteroides stercorirosoris]OKZ12271.1 MAG: hypothetical protein BHV75_05495 [Bacteroides oleiciplenus]SHI59046.1 Starch-binding associating with outer membrane [Bacteroides stercorirosoris]